MNMETGQYERESKPVNYNQENTSSNITTILLLDNSDSCQYRTCLPSFSTPKMS